MIIVEKANNNLKATEAAQEARDPTFQDSPPPYLPSSSSTSEILASSSSSNFVASNFVVINRQNEGIKAAYVLDPTMVIQPSMLPPLDAGEERKNLSLQSKNGAVEADVTIAPVDNHGMRATISVKSRNGQVHCNLHRSMTYPTFSFYGYSRNGQVKVCIPRSFCGPVSATTENGTVKVSRAVAARQTPFNYINDTNKSFIGDASGYLEKGGKNWHGDELILESKNGSIKISYDDELEENCTIL